MKTENVEKIIVHCSATREGDDSVNVEVIDRWHKARGWRGCGYHFVVLMDGKIEDNSVCLLKQSILNFGIQNYIIVL